MSEVNIQQAKQSVRGNYPPDRADKYVEVTRQGCLMLLRELKYKRDVLKGLRMSIALVKQMAMLHHAVNRRKILYMSIRELTQGEMYRFWAQSARQLANEFDGMVKRGLMVRTYRDGLTGRGKVMIWGLTAEGRRLVLEYYAYLGGAYDEESWGI